MYQLVFRGQIAPDVEPCAARANAAQIFKANQRQLERMFSGERVIIRSKLDRDAAAKYQLALASKGMIVHVEAMASRSGAPVPTTPADKLRSGPGDSGRTASAPAGSGLLVEPGERLPVAGERVDQLLAGSDLRLGRPGEMLGQPRTVEAPVFERLDTWSLAAAGETLHESAPKPKVRVPDISHLRLLPAD